MKHAVLVCITHPHSTCGESFDVLRTFDCRQNSALIAIAYVGSKTYRRGRDIRPATSNIALDNNLNHSNTMSGQRYTSVSGMGPAGGFQMNHVGTRQSGYGDGESQ